jgi:ATP-binding cassette subfamily C protein CydD
MSFLRMLGLARPEARRFLAVALIGLSISAAYVVSAIAAGRIFSAVLAKLNLGEITPLVFVAICAIVARGALIAWREVAAVSAASHVKETLRECVYRALLRVGPAYLNTARTGKLQNAIVDGVELMEAFYSRFLTQALGSLVAGLAIAVYVFTLDRVVGAIVSVALLTIPLASIVTNALLKNSITFWYETYGELSAEYVDSIQGLPTLRAFGADERRGSELATYAGEVRAAAERLTYRECVQTGVTQFAVVAATGIAVVIGAIRTADGYLAAPSLLVILLLVRECFRPIDELSAAYHYALPGLAAAQKIFELLDTEPNVADPSLAAPLPNSLSTLAFENVCFSYASNDSWALKNVTFKVARGETIAIVGHSGSGKTTLASLLLRFYDPTSGSIELDGIDIRSLSLSTLRQTIAIVAQDTFLFHGTVRETLTFAKPHATQEELEAATSAAAALEFISELPLGFDTVIGERGVKLSGGERQRLAIARAMLKNAPILILDEATSSVDIASEAAIVSALERLKSGRTTIVIAHRPSTVAGADRIVVLENGRVAESGSPSELIANVGDYARFVTSQSEAS